jgi:L-tartrate/succinate antiporter
MKSVRWLVPIGLGVILRFLPAPNGLNSGAWHFFALFVAVVAALVTEPLPGPAVGLLGVSLAAAFVLVGQTPADAMRWALSGFSNDIVWLMFSANMFALGYDATGLGRRIALHLVKALGKRTLGLGYAVALSDLVLAPVMPSNTARSGGTIYPVVKNIPPLYGSTPDQNPRKIGAYLMWTGFATTCVTSSMFITALSPNLLAVQIAGTIAHVQVTWSSWLIGFLPVGILLFAATPLLTYFFCPPEIKRGDEVTRWASAELSLVGPITQGELTMALLVLAALLSWIAGGRWVAPVTVGLVAISIMLLAKVVSWDDIAANKKSWSALIWLATLVTMADGLNIVGFLRWFANRSTSLVATAPPIAFIVAIVSLFFVVHYFFASTTAHTVALLPVFLAAVLGVHGLPTKAITLMLLYSSGLMGVLTPYATGPAPVWYASGYIPAKDFWRLGAIFGLIYLAALLGLGLPYVLTFMR